MAAELLPLLSLPSRRGPQPALIVDDQRLSAADLAAAAARHRGHLKALGIRPGDRVGVIAEGSVAAAIALVGNLSYGAVSVPLGPKLGPRERDHILGDAAPVAVFASPQTAALPWSPTPQLPQQIPQQIPRVAIDPTSSHPEAPAQAIDPEQPALILYTSGTTGAPKGAVLTAGNLAHNLDALAAAWQWSADDRVVHSLPLFHVHGLVLGLFGALRAGGCLHWLPRFEPRALLAAVGRGQTVLFAVPTIYHRLTDLLAREPHLAAGLQAARLLVSGSAGLGLHAHRRLAELAGVAIYERYGLTETLINCAVPASGPPQPGYVGPALRGVELRLVDDDRVPGIPQDDATLGEVAVRGPNVFAGYLHRPEATAAVRDAAGWFYTGDLATWRSDGAVRIVGRRATDLIKTGGYKVGAGEVEAALAEHPEVGEAAVIGVADDDLGERIVAFVVCRDPAAPPDTGSLADWVAELLAPHKRPRELHLVDALPRTALGKVQKPTLQRWLREERVPR